MNDYQIYRCAYKKYKAKYRRLKRRGGSSLDENPHLARYILNENRLLILFPEGTYSITSELGGGDEIKLYDANGKNMLILEIDRDIINNIRSRSGWYIEVKDRLTWEEMEDNRTNTELQLNQSTFAPMRNALENILNGKWWDPRKGRIISYTEMQRAHSDEYKRADYDSKFPLAKT